MPARPYDTDPNTPGIQYNTTPDHLGGTYEGAAGGPRGTYVLGRGGSRSLTQQLADQGAAPAPVAPLAGLEPQDMRFASDADLEKYIRSNYGYFASFLNDPEMRKVLFDAARNTWDEGNLYAAVTQTSWWQNTNAAARTWQKLQNEDPAEARRLVGQTAATVQNRARSLGLPLSGGQIAGIAATATQNGWTDAQTIDHLVQNVNWNTIEGGDLTAQRDNVKAIAGDYLVNVSDQTAQNYAARIASGELTAAGVQSIMLKQAKARFGWMASELDQGATVKDFFMPIRDTIARELEMATEDIDLMDSKWLSLMEKTGEDGKPRAATLNEAMLGARRKPEWAKTNKAQEMTANVTGMFSNLFGRSAV